MRVVAEDASVVCEGDRAVQLRRQPRVSEAREWQDGRIRLRTEDHST